MNCVNHLIFISFYEIRTIFSFFDFIFTYLSCPSPFFKYVSLIKCDFRLKLECAHVCTEDVFFFQWVFAVWSQTKCCLWKRTKYIPSYSDDVSRRKFDCCNRCRYNMNMTIGYQWTKKKNKNSEIVYVLDSNWRWKKKQMKFRIIWLRKWKPEIQMNKF